MECADEIRLTIFTETGRPRATEQHRIDCSSFGEVLASRFQEAFTCAFFRPSVHFRLAFDSIQSGTLPNSILPDHQHTAESKLGMPRACSTVSFFIRKAA
jgi:hypothetical protein